jgi:hypothetical protein
MHYTDSGGLHYETALRDVTGTATELSDFLKYRYVSLNNGDTF